MLGSTKLMVQALLCILSGSQVKLKLSALRGDSWEIPQSFINWRPVTFSLVSHTGNLIKHLCEDPGPIEWDYYHSRTRQGRNFSSVTGTVPTSKAW